MSTLTGTVPMFYIRGGLMNKAISKQDIKDILEEELSTPSVYNVVNRKCVCNGTGLFPPHAPKCTTQSFCPQHRIQRHWPQLQKDGSVQFKKLYPSGSGHIGLMEDKKGARR